MADHQLSTIACETALQLYSRHRRQIQQHEPVISRSDRLLLGSLLSHQRMQASSSLPLDFELLPGQMCDLVGIPGCGSVETLLAILALALLPKCLVRPSFHPLPPRWVGGRGQRVVLLSSGSSWSMTQLKALMRAALQDPPVSAAVNSSKPHSAAAYNSSAAALRSYPAASAASPTPFGSHPFSQSRLTPDEIEQVLTESLGRLTILRPSSPLSLLGALRQTGDIVESHLDSDLSQYLQGSDGDDSSSGDSRHGLVVIDSPSSFYWLERSEEWVLGHSQTGSYQRAFARATKALMDEHQLAILLHRWELFRKRQEGPAPTAGSPSALQLSGSPPAILLSPGGNPVAWAQMVRHVLEFRDRSGSSVIYTAHETKQASR
ncbi:uncharacterized protein BJ171DRAFT_133004 [Polychytrium aggregatum]|uniref:uncharacterized protein n=1 Tax=Polychytrium aggregatum TaxID=110093 RepID=UPI0022FE4780|nr:uncharacterized protein BJ171DRAFT_133004 [Polychytrium aggregatum]KAI9203787.1 hypothetical protein BJ171DRAFT_133004 [Polychytrium aggregatum]